MSQDYSGQGGGYGQSYGQSYGQTYAAPSGLASGPQAPLFQDTSGAPPPPAGQSMVDTAQMLAANPMLTTAAQQYGQNLASRGQAYIDQNVSRFVATSHIKNYFAVDTNYVLKKLGILLFPFTHSNWNPQYQQSEPVPPRQDLNAPDLYIPVMGFLTYILVTGLALGTQQKFTPEQLGLTASSLLAWLLAEVLLIWLCLYLLAVNTQLKWLDIIAFCGYKYVCMIVVIVLGLLGGRYGYYGGLCYTALAIAYFLVQSLRLSIQPNVTEGASKVRNYFLLIIAILQPLLMLWLTFGLLTFSAPAAANSDGLDLKSGR